MNKSHVKKILVLAVACTLGACATSTPLVYEAAADEHSTGYMEVPVENGRHAVAYTGTKGMTREQVAQLAMLRAAELTQSQGNEWFAVIDKTTQIVQLRRKEDLQAKSGGVLTGEAASTTSAGAGRSPNAPAEGGTRGGPSTGGFGGGDVPYQVLERWQPPTVNQAVLIIQTGKGKHADFTGLDKAPEIFDAKSLSAEIRTKLGLQQ